jgi:isopenicillin-N epimerase
MVAPSLKSQFLLDPEIAFLNFGSFGACPRPVFETYQNWQLLLEREPVQFISVNGPSNLKNALVALADYIYCAPEDVVFITNPSYGLNIVAKSLQLKPGDEILSTSLEYGASDITWEHICKRSGAKYIKADIQLPVTTKEQVIERVVSRITSKTKLLFISHITSSTALKLPAVEICDIARRKGVMTFIDGAHAAGHIPLNVSETNADIYTGACHKWMMAPKGSSFLFIKKDFQKLFDPLMLSWGFKPEVSSPSFFAEWHLGQGTRDFSAFLTVPAAIDFMRKNEWRKVSEACHESTLLYAARFCEVLKQEPLAPLTSDFIGQMFSLPVRTTKPEELQKLLFEKYKVEIPVMRHGDKIFMRYSVNAFNTAEDLGRLFAALENIIKTTSLIEQ